MNNFIVVTGASGLIGNALIKYLNENINNEIIPVSRNSNNKHFFNVNKYDDTPKGKILIHLAENSNRKKVNDIGNKHIKESLFIVDKLIKKKYEKFIYCSSSALYGDIGSKKFEENSQLFINDVYTKSKFECEKRVIQAGGIVVRISNIIGYEINKQNIFSDILYQLNLKNTIININDDKPIRDFIDLNDLNSALLELILYGKKGIYNIGSSKGFAIGDILNIILKISNYQFEKINIINQSNIKSFNVLNINKFMKEYNWKPKKNIYDSLSTLVKQKLNNFK